MLKYRYRINATKELFFTFGGFKRVGGWCKSDTAGEKSLVPEQSGGTFSMPLRKCTVIRAEGLLEPY